MIKQLNTDNLIVDVPELNTEDIGRYAPDFAGAGSAEDLGYVLDLINRYEEIVANSGNSRWFVPGTPFSIDNCPKHKAFFEAGAKYHERFFCAGNRCLSKGTLVATPSGPRAIETLKVGDTVFDRYAIPTTVTATWENGVREVVSLVNRGKEYLRCTSNHKLDVVDIGRTSTWKEVHNKERRVEAAKLSKNTLVKRSYPLAPLGPKFIPEAYVIGAFLGDGCCTCGNSVTVVISSADYKVPAKIAEILNTTYKKNKSSYSWYITWRGTDLYDSWCRGRLCHEKFVDIEELKLWDRASCIAFIAGLIDTDGSLCHSRDGFTLSFSNQSKSIVDAYCYLMLALWQEDPHISVDSRDKYKHGHIFNAIIRNPHAITRIMRELAVHLAHSYKANIAGISSIGKRSRKEAIKLSIANAPTCMEETFDITVEHPEHCFLLANGLSVSNSGKSVAGSLEVSFHLTGEYPSWWKGRRFDHPTSIWACGPDAKTTRDTVQKELLGPIGAFGTGMIPRNKIARSWALSGVPQGVDTVEVRHISGGMSTCSFKNYEQDIRAFYGTAKDVVWLDEETPNLVYNECLLRTMTTNGIVLCTFTPLHGLTPLVVRFCRAADFLAGSMSLAALMPDKKEDEEDLEHLLPQTPKAVITAGWDDAPWLTEDAKRRMLEDTPSNLRDARSKGIPAMGSGNVYPIPLDEITVAAFDIPPNWKRIYGLDVGWNKTACIWAAIDPNSDTIFIYDEHYQGQAHPAIHAEAIRSRGSWITGVIDPASRGRSQVDGQNLMQIYKDLGLKLWPAKNEVEGGITNIWNRLSTGKLKVFKHLINFQKEYLLYRRDEHGRIVKENDHLLDALRYVVNNLNKAKAKDQGSTSGVYSGTRSYDI